MPTPPYRIIQTPTFSARDLTESLFFAEDLLERRLDEFPRPFLCAALQKKNDRFDLVLTTSRNPSNSEMNPIEETHSASLSGSRHHSIWFHTEDLSNDLSRILTLMKERITAEPFCTIDFVLPLVSVPKPQETERLVSLLETQRNSYLSRTLAHRGENLQHRLVFVFDGNHLELKNWRDGELNSTSYLIYERIPTNRIQKLNPSQEAFYLVEGEEIDGSDFDFLKEEMDPEAITFSSRKLEERWSVEVLGYGEL